MTQYNKKDLQILLESLSRPSTPSDMRNLSLNNIISTAKLYYLRHRRYLINHGKAKYLYPLDVIRKVSEVYRIMEEKSKCNLYDYLTYKRKTRVSVVKRVMFEEPLERVPLYINDIKRDYIAEWRLQIGK